MRRIRPACCALATNGHAVAIAPPTSVMNVRRCISSLDLPQAPLIQSKLSHSEATNTLASNNQSI
jgi:hypothetical protein